MARIVLTLALTVASLASADSKQPTITFPEIDFEDPGFPDGLLRVSGSGFGTEFPTVSFADVILGVVTSTDNKLTAELPASLSPGTYNLVVTNKNKSATFDVTVGTQR